MTDVTIGSFPVSLPRKAHRPQRRRRGVAEYQTYCAILTAVALPGGAMGFAWDALRGRPGPSPWARARAHAGVIAPMIFAR